MKKKIPLSYSVIQRIKAEEYARFYSQLPEYDVYMNHLGEIQWMTEDEATKQHEFFLYNESLLKRWQRRLRLNRKINIDKLSQAEREIRLYLRQYLEKKHKGEIQPETGRMIPQEWQYEISDEDLEHISISTEVGGEGIWRAVLIAFSVFAALAIISYIWSSKYMQNGNGSLLVKSGEINGRVFLNNSEFLGYTNTILTHVPIGKQRITLKKVGYETIPMYHDVQIKPDSLIEVEFEWKKSRSAGKGYVRINAEYNDSKVFINKRFKGILTENQVLVLEAGEYAVSVVKDGYLTVPAEKMINIVPGDTVFYSVEQILVSSGTRNGRSVRPDNIGSIAISSNIRGAKIFLNGKDMEHETDYIFTQLPLGRYQVRLRKEGYDIQPDKLIINLTRANPAGNVDFQITRTFEKVTIKTKPSNGTIYIDNDFKGEGSFEGVLKVGSHSISFGDISGFKRPRVKIINLKAGSPVNLDVNYFPKLNIFAGINNSGTMVYDNCQVHTGYTFKNQAFTAGTDGGPEIQFNDRIQDYAWKMGYAFPYRNPKGNDAIKITFELPRNLDFDQTFTLRLIAASSQEKYPLSISTKVDISIKFNNNILSYYYEPKFLEDLGSLNKIEWDITANVRPGVNTLEIATTDKNNAFYYLKRIEIFN